MRRIFATSFVLVAALSGFGATKGFAGIDGVYYGSMHLVDDDNPRDIPLGISLTESDETIPGPTGGVQPVIDGSFAIDEEGGPYLFTKISWNSGVNKIDLRYSRPRLDPSTSAPAAFRLNGGWQLDGSLQGRVISGFHSVIGTFKVVKSNDSMLRTRNKYVGNWKNKCADSVPKDECPDIEFVLAPSMEAHINPPNFEFEFTPGKTGSLRYMKAQFPASRVAIDYLRRKLSFVNVVQGDPSVSFQASVDFSKNQLVGVFNSLYAGQRWTVTLQK